MDQQIDMSPHSDTPQSRGHISRFDHWLVGAWTKTFRQNIYDAALAIHDLDIVPTLARMVGWKRKTHPTGRKTVQ